MEFRDLLLGVTKNKLLAFGDLEIKDDNRFSMCFTLVHPFKIEESDGYDWAESMLDGISDEEKYNLCERYDCRPSDLAENLITEYGIQTNADEIDCYNGCDNITIGEDEYAFEWCSGGQADIMEDGEMLVTSDEKNVRILYEMWCNKHLQTISEEEKAKIIKCAESLDKIDVENQIAEYIKKYSLDKEGV